MKNHISNGQFGWYYFIEIFRLMQCLNRNYTQRYTNTQQKLHKPKLSLKRKFKPFEHNFKSNFEMLVNTENSKIERHKHVHTHTHTLKHSHFIVP